MVDGLTFDGVLVERRDEMECVPGHVQHIGFICFVYSSLEHSLAITKTGLQYCGGRRVKEQME